MRQAVDAGVDSDKRDFKAHTEFSGLTRIFHWLRAFAIFGLIGTGFYIAVPFLSPTPSSAPISFTQAYIRSIHVILGFVLISVSIFRLYLFFFDKGSKEERRSFSQFIDIKIWISTIKTYLFIGKHPYIKGAYNPLQIVTYFTLGILVLFISLTGIALYANVYHNGLGGVLGACFKWVEVLCGGLSNVRVIHHILTWAFIIFIPVHIYIVVWNAVKYPNGGADAIISGVRYQHDVKV